MSGGILRSNLHRVVYDSSSSPSILFSHLNYRTPPKEQANFERWSLVYFSRPYDTVELNALTDESPMIAEAVAKSSDPEKWHPGQTAKEWVARRNKYQRPTNWTVSLSECSHPAR